MLAEKKRDTNIGVGIGFVLQLLGNILQSRGGTLSLVGLAVFIWGCMSYCEGKSYSRWLGLPGLLSIIGMLGNEEVGSRLDGVPDVLAGLLIHGLHATDGDRHE